MTEPPACDDKVGHLVRDEASGRTGVLMAILDYEDGSRYPRTRERLAFLRPERGGREWTTPPERVTVIGPVSSDRSRPPMHSSHPDHTTRRTPEESS